MEQILRLHGLGLHSRDMDATHGTRMMSPLTMFVHAINAERVLAIKATNVVDFSPFHADATSFIVYLNVECLGKHRERCRDRCHFD